MSLITKLTPINLPQEKAKFFNDFSYNPQFVYAEEINPKVLTKYGLPQAKYLSLAQEICDRAYFGRNELDLLMMEGPALSQAEVTAKTIKFLKLHQLDHKYEVVWSSSFVARTTTDANTIRYRSPVQFRKNEFIGTLYHEIGTHALRQINYEKQPWYKKKKEFGFSDYLRTEEGLATLHSFIPTTIKLAYDVASRYLTIAYAQHHSFSDLWQFMQKYIQNPERRWNHILRCKRGLTDTSQYGGFTKDIVYLEGLVEVWHWLIQHKFDLAPLYFGKMAVQDIQLALQANPNFVPLLPSFYITNPSQYQIMIEKIGIENKIDQI